MTPDRLLSAADAWRLHRIPAGTVRSWHFRRKTTGLEAKGLDKWGKPLFREKDLLALKNGRRRLRTETGERRED